MAKARIIGTGAYAPGAPIGNEELVRLTGVELDTEKLEGKIGIKTRHIARLRGMSETTADFAEKAARAAITDAGLGPMDMDLIVVGTDTPEYVSPATAILVQGRLQGGQRDTAVFDVAASCASFVTGLDVAARMMAGDPELRRAVVIGVYNMPAHVREGDAFGWSIFADGAGAVVLSRAEDSDQSGYVTGKFVSDGTQWDYVGVYAGGTRKPVTKELLDAGAYGLENLQRLPGDRNVKLWPPIIRALCDKGGIPVEKVSRFVMTQINRSVILEVMDILGRPRELAPLAMDRYGYTGSACVPMAFHHAVKDGLVRRGDPIVFCASGAGFAVGANLFIY